MNIKSKKGVTLVEVVVAVAILGIIITPISLVFTTAYTNFTSEADKTKAQDSARAVLYGKGIDRSGNRSYGVMGDLERSGADGDSITIGNLIVSSDISKGYSISIKDDADVTRTYSYDPAGRVLEYKNGLTAVNYFDKEKSSTNKEVIVTDFSAEKKKKGDSINGTTIANDLIIINVTVTCGKGVITLESSYRIPNIEK